MSYQDLYYQKGRDEGDLYNFDIIPLIEDFSFLDFCHNAPVNKDHGGFIVITNKQFLVGYNAGFGEGSHLFALARVMKELHGGGRINTEKEAFKLLDELQEKHLFAFINYVVNRDIGTHQFKRIGYIAFVLNLLGKNKKVTNLQYQNFLLFYEKYNDEIKEMCKKNKVYVDYTTCDSNGRVIHHYSKDLDDLKNYLNDVKVNTRKVDDETIIMKDINKKSY